MESFLIGREITEGVIKYVLCIDGVNTDKTVKTLGMLYDALIDSSATYGHISVNKTSKDVYLGSKTKLIQTGGLDLLVGINNRYYIDLDGTLNYYNEYRNELTKIS